MSTGVALLLATGLSLAPWLLMNHREPRETGGLVALLWWLNAGYCAFWHRFTIERTDSLPKTGPVILISNHTCCIDHMLLQATTRRLLGFLIAKELYDYWLFQPLCRVARCIPVRRDGRDVSAMRASLRALQEGRVVPIFPEGRITPTSGRDLGEARPGVSYIALRANVPVIPAYISGTPPTRNVLWSYLTPSKAKVVFGPPVDLSDLIHSGRLDRDQFDEATRRLMAALKALRNQTYPTLAHELDFTTVGEAVDEGETADGPTPDRAIPALSLVLDAGP